jgi:hypothetical protein
VKRAPWAIALAALLTYALTGGGRITGSDELAQLDLARAMLHGQLVVPEGSTMRGPDGRIYTKNTWGQALLALPLVAAGVAAAHVGGFSGTRAELATRFIPSFFNGIVGALLLAAAYSVMRSLKVSTRASLAATLMLGFTTPLWVSAKGFACEPVEALGMLLALGGGALAGAATVPEDRRRGERWAAFGGFLAIFVKLGVAPMVFACLSAIWIRRPRAWLIPLCGVAASFATHAIYNWLRFGNVLETGYGSQQSIEAFSTPLHVGALGLLFSPGKGAAWFAPMLWLAPLGILKMAGGNKPSTATRGDDAVRHAGWAIVAAWTVGVIMYGRFQHWAGDGSWGPRYLAPLLPAGAIAVGFAVDAATRSLRRLSWVLAAIGLIVTLGGVGIYFGAEMREVKDYPYTLALEDPQFMHASHWEWHQSPILVSWRMLARNLGEHATGHAPVLGQPGPVDPRTGVTDKDAEALKHAIDVWWLYAGYAGIPKLPLGLAAIVLLAGSIWAWGLAWGAVRAETA